MRWFYFSVARFLGVGALAWLAACAQAPTPATDKAQQRPSTPECTPPAEGEPLIGNWLNKRQEKGVTGELRTLITLKADGSMLFTEQLKRPRQPSQGLNEAGCWWREGQVLVLQSYTSNGAPVDVDDPIYTNRYHILEVASEQLDVRSEQGIELRTQRTSPGYRLPF